MCIRDSSIFFYLLTIIIVQADNLDYFGKKIDIRILDKLSSKSKLLKLDIGENFLYKNLEIKVLKCKNSKFDDNPEITTYLQVKDNKNSNINFFSKVIKVISLNTTYHQKIKENWNY